MSAKVYTQMLNALDQVQTNTFGQRRVKENAMKNLRDSIRDLGFKVTYVPGKGFKAEDEKS